MTNTPKPTLEEVLPEARAFHRAFNSLMLATADAAGRPYASYAVHVADEWGRFHIYISELAAHTGHLRARDRASVLFIEDESQANHLFARQRLTCDCRAEWMPRDTPAWHEAMDRFVAKHGKFMEMLKGLADFQLFRLVPETAVYVRGFGQAYELSGEQLSEIRHINGQGHRPTQQGAAALKADP
ncbi:HugZ family pyridoxamine 5'-phosphate oxidase [Methylomagnum sp.]